jgi:hypothetical protein
VTFTGATDGWVLFEMAHGDGCPVSDAVLQALVERHGLPRSAFPALFGVAV